MKLLSAMTLFAILSVGLTAQVDAKGRENPPPRPDFSTIDSDNNGVISFSEFSAQELPPGVSNLQSIFDEIDTDNNGEISEQELQEHKPPRRQRK